MYLAQEREYGNELQDPSNAGNFLNNWRTLSILRSVLLMGLVSQLVCYLSETNSPELTVCTATQDVLEGCLHRLDMR
jgi:hypothetical protein